MKGFKGLLKESTIPASIEDYNYQMSNLSKEETNLPMVIWIESNTRTSQHDTPSLKFANSYSNKQREIDDLIKVWNQEITPAQFVIKINEQK